MGEAGVDYRVVVRALDGRRHVIAVHLPLVPAPNDGNRIQAWGLLEIIRDVLGDFALWWDDVVARFQPVAEPELPGWFVDLLRRVDERQGG